MNTALLILSISCIVFVFLAHFIDKIYERFNFLKKYKYFFEHEFPQKALCIWILLTTSLYILAIINYFI